ncbi:MAG: hypothetical protein ABIL58_20330 [Pseudomonadota bacterium]
MPITIFQNGRLRDWLRGMRRWAGAGRMVPLRRGRTDFTVPPQMETIPPATIPTDTLEAYLFAQGNFPEDILKCRGLMALPRQIVEIGCGTADIARQVALQNPDIGVLATDIFDWSGPGGCGSGYRRVALAWREKRLNTQQACPENLAVLRAEIAILDHLPPHSIDAVMLINPEPTVGKAILTHLAAPAMYRKLKPGAGRIVVMPFSREMGIMSCGGLEFDHGPDFSRGLGFLKSSPLAFHKGGRQHWNVDLAASRYTPNSTQSDVYVHQVAPQ